MAIPKREQIQAALFARLKGSITGLKTSTRRYLDFAKLAQTQQPALSVYAFEGRGGRAPPMPTKWKQHAMIVFYVRIPTDPAATVESALFDLIEQAENALDRQPGETGMGDDYGTTLGGLVWQCLLSDWHFHHEGLGAGQAAASASVEMLALK